MERPPADARRVSVSAERLPRWLVGFEERHGAVTVSSSSTELVLHGDDGARAWITVPFPPCAGTTLSDLMAHVQRRRRVGVLLVRRGGYAVGVVDGDRLVTSKVGSGYVQGGTKAGGWSQQRFARRRANQARALFDEAADVTVRILGQDAARLDAVVVGGDRGAVESVLRDERLAALGPLITEPFLAVPDPRLRVLEGSIAEFRSVRISLYP